MTIEEATRILLQKIADRQKIVGPAIRHGIEKEIGSEFWLKRGQWEGLEMAYDIVHEWINDNADLLKEREAFKPRILYTTERHCGYCDKILDDGWLTCPWCGTPVSFKVGEER